MTILTVSCMVYFCLCYFYLFILSYLQFNIATNGLDGYDEYQDKHYIHHQTVTSYHQAEASCYCM